MKNKVQIAFNRALPLTARRAIKDSPLAKIDSSARAGERGEIVDEFDEFLAVDFGRGAIICEPCELAQ
jgi:hypothetical protein